MATQFVKGALPRVGQRLIALVLGQLFVLPFWYIGILELDGADPSEVAGWVVAFVYALVGTAAAMQAHDVGSSPKTVIKRIKNGKAVGG